MLKFISNIFDFNPSFESGSMDIIIVKNENKNINDNGSNKIIYKSSPFYINFPENKEKLSKKEKEIKLIVNNKEIDHKMYLSSNGKAKFLLVNDHNSRFCDYTESNTKCDIKKSEIEINNFKNNKEYLDVLNCYDSFLESLNEEKAIFLRELLELSKIKFSKCLNELRFDLNIEEFEEIFKSNELNTIIYDKNDIKESLLFKNDGVVLFYDKNIYEYKIGVIVMLNVVFNNTILGNEIINSISLFEVENRINLLEIHKNKELLRIFDKLKDNKMTEKLKLININKKVGKYENIENKEVIKIKNEIIVSDEQKYDNNYNMEYSLNEINENKISDNKNLKIKVEKSNTPNSEIISKFNLNNGKNKITFVSNTKRYGEVKIDSIIYLYDDSDKLIISDVDGTITKSDILGHILPTIGLDWSHCGIARLLKKIKLNGYKILYLTSRPIGRSEITRKFLYNVDQSKIHNK